MEYNSDYEIRLAELEALGGDITINYDSVYEIDLAILEQIMHGGGEGARIDDDNVSPYTTYSSQKIMNLLSGAGFTVLIVQELPVSGDAHTIYWVPKDVPETQNIYDEYIYANNAWEKFGSTDVDLSQYYTSAQTDTLLDAKANANAVYTSAQTDTLLAAKANANAVYTSAQTDTLLAAKQGTLTASSGITITNNVIATEYTYVHAVLLTQQEYDDLQVKDANTLYIITDAQ